MSKKKKDVADSFHRIVKKSGHSGHVILPKKTVGSEVIVVLKEQEKERSETKKTGGGDLDAL